MQASAISPILRSTYRLTSTVHTQTPPRTPQVSMQFHELEGRGDRLEALLKQEGRYDTVVRWQEPRFRGSSIWMMYAKRTQGWKEDARR